jgi:hypothetical protein
LGRFSEARQYFIQALERSQRAHMQSRAIRALVGIANLLADDGEKEKALELLSMVLQHPMSWQMEKDRAAELQSVLEDELSPQIIAAAKERGRARDLDVTVAELLADLKDKGE